MKIASVSSGPAAGLSIKARLTLCMQGLIVLAASGSVQAHHPLGGATPETFMHGLLSGIGHPIIGLDHLAFIVAVGLLSVFCVRGVLMPLFFVLATMLGTGLHLLALELPRNELIVASSVLLAGIVLILQRQWSWKPIALLFAAAGLFHGFAYGEAVYGAEATPIVAYLLGFGLTQYLIALAAMATGFHLCRQTALEAAWLRIGGGVVCGVSLVLLYEQLLPF